MPSAALLQAMFAHVMLSGLLYVLLTLARAPAVWGIGRAADGSNPLAALERRISANLSNQFEWPLFFHLACVLLIHFGQVDATALILAWTFVAGRVAHSAVQIGTANVRLRGLVYTVNFVAALALWGVLICRV